MIALTRKVRKRNKPRVVTRKPGDRKARPESDGDGEQRLPRLTPPPKKNQKQPTTKLRGSPRSREAPTHKGKDLNHKRLSHGWRHIDQRRIPKSSNPESKLVIDRPRREGKSSLILFNQSQPPQSLLQSRRRKAPGASHVGIIWAESINFLN
jgi:hypothetical protein